MRKAQKTLLKVGIAIVIIIIIIIIVMLLMRRNVGLGEQENLDFLDYPGYLILGLKPEKENSANTYFSVEACIEKAISYAKENNSLAVYNLLNLEYIKDKGITQSNVMDITGLNNIKKYKTQEIYELVGSNYASYYLKAIIQDNKNMYFNINWDMANSAFDIKVLTKSEFEKYIETTIEDVKPEEDFVEKNNNNSIPYKYLAEEDLVKKYFFDYINSVVDFPEEAYNNLDEEYRMAKFGSKENFMQYALNNTEWINLYKSGNTDFVDFDSPYEYLAAKGSARFSEYSIENKGNYTQYLCVDSYGNNYIFKATSLMQYTLVLDTYTIDIPEFTEKYEVANDQEKVILNLNKFMQAINSKDYKYAYGLLADSFKANNFKTEQEFENYVKTNFFEKNEFDYQEFGDEANTYYTYQVKITDKTEKSANAVTKTFIILLEEGTDFKLSFNI